MKMKLFQDYDSEKSWLSEKWNNGDWNIYFLLRVQYLEDMMGDEAPAKYCVEILAVSPEAAGPDNVKKAIDSCGNDTEGKEIPDDMKVEALASYGIYAPLYSKSGNNMKSLLKEARKEFKLIHAFTFGFKMDCPVNRIGDTGWDWLQGNLGAALKRKNA